MSIELNQVNAADASETSVEAAGEVATPTPVETPKPVLSAREKLENRIAEAEARIARDTTFVEESRAKLDIVDKLDAVAQGWVVDIRVGRAETSRVVKGVVVGVDGQDDKKRYKVYHGEGFDAETTVIQQHQILAAENPAA